MMDLTSLQQHCRGDMAEPGDPDYLTMVKGNLWNQLLPERFPDLVVRVKDEQDVIAVLRYAREQGLKVVVRGAATTGASPLSAEAAS
jgi:FAD/FMN-containing dehydrogenase